MKLEKKHFEYFVKRCKFWLDFWGIKNWDIRYKFEATAKEELATTASQIIDHVAVITLDNDSDWEDSSYEFLDRIAFHEVDEVRYAKLDCLANMRFVDPTQIRETIHSLIVQEENTIFKHNKKEEV